MYPTQQVSRPWAVQEDRIEIPKDNDGMFCQEYKHTQLQFDVFG
jgi:hypothetical protein